VAFTNVWDVTFPPDTQFANLLGQDLRNFRVDTQQRMAAISGLDASKPAFSGDAQPANWNGILFFAIDTGKIYQWTNPTWNDVTNSLLKIPTVFKSSAAVDVTGDNVLHTLVNFALPHVLFSVNTIIRVSFPQVSQTVAGGGGVTVSTLVNFGGSVMGGFTANSAGGSLSQILPVILGGNNGATNLQSWYELAPNFGNAINTTHIDTTVDTTLTVTSQIIGNTASHALTAGVLVEIFT
jgi:hypothetical protein